METKPTSTLGEALREGALVERAPAHLRMQVLASIRQESAAPRKRDWFAMLRGGRFAFAGGGAAGMALGALLAVVIFSSQMPMRAPGVEQEIVSSHVRALISTRSIDVISTDQHTVKPWFNGRIDYAPPVIDPEAAGFPLVGGRLDYVDHRPVAVMVYRYLKHPIDLYVFPATDAGGAANTRLVTHTSEGYSLVQWRHNGMVHWAISDASPVYVERFADAIIRGESQ